MPRYKYFSITEQGQERRGFLEAATDQEAKQQLRVMGLMPLSVKVSQRLLFSERLVGLRPFLQRRVSLEDQAFFFRQLSSLLEAKLSIERALMLIQSDKGFAKQRSMLGKLLEGIRSGEGLASVMRKEAGFFLPSHVAAVGAAETAGVLSLVLTQLADEMEQLSRLKNKIFSAMAYPILVSGFALLVVIFLMTTVVPQLANAFAEKNSDLPVLTTGVLWLSEFIATHGYWLVSGCLLIGVLHLALLKLPPWRLRWERLILALPFAGKLYQLQASIKLANSLAVMLSAGVPVERALKQVTAVVALGVVRRGLDRSAILVQQGATLSAALDQTPYLDRKLVTFVHIGEQGSVLVPMLKRVAADLSEEFSRRCALLTSVIEPLMIIIMGGVVLTIVLAIMLPILQLNQLVAI